MKEIRSIEELAAYAKQAFYEAPDDVYYTIKTIAIGEELKGYLEQSEARDGFNRLYEIPGSVALSNYMIIRVDKIEKKDGKYACTLSIQFMDRKEDMLALIELENVVKSNISGLDELQKALYVNDFLCNYLAYDKEQRYRSAAMGAKHKTGTCTAYAGIFKVLGEAAGLKVGCIKSDKMRHRWNYVLIDGEMYYIDTTFNGAKEENKHKFFQQDPLHLDKATDQMVVIKHKE